MREIRFRAWDKETNKFLNLEWDDYYIDMSSGELYEIEERSSNYQTYIHKRYLSQAVLMQYTGLQDKAGKDIYEGDVIKVGPSARKVVFDSGAFWAGGYLVSGLYDPEVIGNIYENPELLKGE